MPRLSTEFDAYFERIGYDGVPAPNYSTLAAIQQAQNASIPFENIDVHLRRCISLDETSIFEKLVSRRRGGYCYELNLLLRFALRNIGFSVQALAARTRLNMREEVPKTHMTLLVSSSSGEWIADAGFGAYGLSGPVPFATGSVHDTGFDRYRILRSSAWHYELQCESGDDWTTLYDFTTEPLPLADFEMMNYYNSTSPKSRFLRSIVVACVNGDRRTLLAGLSLRKCSRRENSERDVRSVETYEAVLQDEFGIHLGSDAQEVFTLSSSL